MVASKLEHDPYEPSFQVDPAYGLGPPALGKQFQVELALAGILAIAVHALQKHYIDAHKYKQLQASIASEVKPTSSSLLTSLKALEW